MESLLQYIVYFANMKANKALTRNENRFVLFGYDVTH